MIRPVKTRRRREASGEFGDGLFAAVVHGLLDGARESLGVRVRRAVRRGSMRAILVTLAAVTWAAALVLVFGAAVEGLKELSLPASLAGLLVAVAAGLGGWALWCSAFRKPSEPD